MKSTISLIGVVIVIIGILALAYQGFTYTKQENIAQIGGLNVTADTQKSVHFPPIFGGICIVAGIILVIVGRKS